MTFVILQSGDGDILQVDLEVAMSIPKIMSRLEFVMDKVGNVEDAVISVPEVDSFILQKVIVWATHYFYHDKNPASAPSAEEQAAGAVGGAGVDTWDSNFLNIDPSIICQLMLAAQKLGVKNLIDATATALSKMMAGKSPEEQALINQMFSLGMNG